METEKQLGAVIILSGPSGAGKSTVCRHVFGHMPQVRFSVSCTTRKPRDGEVDGKDYHFLTVEAFKQKIADGEFLEWAEVHGNYYGTLISEVANTVLSGGDVILDIDVQGQAQITKAISRYEDWGRTLISIFIVPPSLTILEQRLRGRGTETEESLQRRLGNAKGEMTHWRDYDYILVNDSSEVAASQLEAIITSAHCRTSTQTKEPWND